jgi:hypothetical protein
MTLTTRGEQLRADDAARRAWLDLAARTPDPDEQDLETVNG